MITKASLQQVFLPTDSAWFTKSAKKTWTETDAAQLTTASKTKVRAYAILQGMVEFPLKAICAIVGWTVGATVLFACKGASAVGRAAARVFCCCNKQANSAAQNEKELDDVAVYTKARQDRVLASAKSSVMYAPNRMI